ncbi:hypothetical protein HOV93_05190 [Planctomycetes bacterium FF15]|uniref:Uncharacterized protein n=1 Tax=Bremerella alba TaxID=980252 RepID=A0A7V8V1V5_9BACT|nr:hypothetical protein [Bremerella alba]
MSFARSTKTTRRVKVASTNRESSELSTRGYVLRDVASFLLVTREPLMGVRKKGRTSFECFGEYFHWYRDDYCLRIASEDKSLVVT